MIEAKRSKLILNCESSEAKRTGSIVILSLKQQQKSEFSFFLKTKGKKRKGSIVNYRSFAITTAHQRQWAENRHAMPSVADL